MASYWFYDDELVRLRRLWVATLNAETAAVAGARTPLSVTQIRTAHEVATRYFARADVLATSRTRHEG